MLCRILAETSAIQILATGRECFEWDGIVVVEANDLA